MKPTIKKIVVVHTNLWKIIEQHEKEQEKERKFYGDESDLKAYCEKKYENGEDFPTKEVTESVDEESNHGDA